MNETSVASTASEPSSKKPTRLKAVVPVEAQAAIEAAKAAHAEIQAKEAELAAHHEKLSALVGKIIVPKDVMVKGTGKITQMHPRYAFGHRLAPAYRIESEPHGVIPAIVPCDELEAGYNVEA